MHKSGAKIQFYFRTLQENGTFLFIGRPMRGAFCLLGPTRGGDEGKGHRGKTAMHTTTQGDFSLFFCTQGCRQQQSGRLAKRHGRQTGLEGLGLLANEKAHGCQQRELLLTDAGSWLAGLWFTLPYSRLSWPWREQSRCYRCALGTLRCLGQQHTRAHSRWSGLRWPS